MQTRKLISVIIPAYNAESFLAETIDTVRNQSYPDWELIIVDDGSTDATQEVAQSYLHDSRIRFVQQKNAGVSAARNNGAALAKGEYLAFLDADDLWTPDYLLQKLDFLEMHPEHDMVVGHIRVMNRLGEMQLVFYYGISGPDAIDKTVEFYDLHSAHPSNIFCRQTAFAKTNGFNTLLSNSADKMFYIDFARVSSIAMINEVLVYYRVHPQNMHRNIDLMMRDFLQFFTILKENKVFRDAAQERYCKVKIYRICAGGSLQIRALGSFVRYLLKAFVTYPEFMLRDLFSKKRFRDTVFSTLYKLGVARLMISRNRKKGKIPVLLFHRVTPERDILYPPIHPDAFANILKFLSRHYRFVSVDDLLKEPEAALKNACCVVFDDGFSDFRHFAVPALEARKVPVTLFVPVKNILDKEVIWTSQLDNSISQTKASQFTLELNGVTETFDLSDEKKKIIAARRLKNILMAATPEIFRQLFADLKTKLEYDAARDAELMHSEELLRLPGNVSIQSHTLTHPYLPSLPENAVEDELYHSRMELEKLLHRPVSYLSYPIGGHNERIRKMAAASYEASFAVDEQLLRLDLRNDTDYRQRLPRFNIHNSNPHEVLFRINGFHKFFGR